MMPLPFLLTALWLEVGACTNKESYIGRKRKGKES